MMKSTPEEKLLLGVESSGMTSAISLGRNGRVLGEISLNIKNIHSRRMTIMVEQILANADVNFSDLGGVILSAGPGSFTGLRIGYSLAKGFAHSLKLPVVQVSTLDIWAYQQGFTILPVISVIDAHRKELFIGEYFWEMETFRRRGDYQLIGFDRLADRVTGQTLFVGGDLRKVGAEIQRRLPENALIPFPLQTAPSASALHTLGNLKYLRQEFSSAEDCEPFYMRSFQGVM